MGVEAYNVLMIINSEQEHSIKELFKEKKWDFKCKVLPSKFSYLWMDDNEDPANNSEESEMILDIYQACKKYQGVNGCIEPQKTEETRYEQTNDRLANKSDHENNIDNNNEGSDTTISVKNKHMDENKSDLGTDDFDKETNIDREENKLEEISIEVKENKARKSSLNKNTAKREAVSSNLKTSKSFSKGSRLAQGKPRNQKRSRLKVSDSNKERKVNIPKHIKNSEIQKMKSDTLPLSSKTCNDCGNKTYVRNNQSFCRHCREQCHFCDKSFAKSSTGLRRLEIHLRQHDGLKPYQCTECGQDFSSKEYLERHKNRRKHNPDVPYDTCKICLKFVTKNGLRSHMKNMHSDRKETFQCDLCGNVFRYKGSLTQHMISVHAKDRKFACDICSSTFTAAHNLRLHKFWHDGQKEVCNICGKVLQGKATLREHMLRHSNQRKYSCSKCSKSFYGKRDLYTHNRIHTGEKPFKCHICSYACAIKGNLTKHMKRHRKGDHIPEHKYKGHQITGALTESTDIDEEDTESCDKQTMARVTLENEDCGKQSDELQSSSYDFKSQARDINMKGVNNEIKRLEPVSYVEADISVNTHTNNSNNINVERTSLETVNLNSDSHVAIDFNNRVMCQLPNMGSANYSLIPIEEATSLYENNQTIDNGNSHLLYHSDIYY